MDPVEIKRFPTRHDADGLRFTLQVVGIHATVSRVPGEGNGHGSYWAVRVPSSQLDQARQILQEEGLTEEPAAEATPPGPTPHASGGKGRPGLHWVVGLILTNVLVWWAMEAHGGSETGQVLLTFGASHAPSVLQGQWWRVVTAVFLHIGARHLLANMITLAVFGPPVLRLFGAGRFLCLYLMSGVAGNLVSLAIAPTPSFKAGASGAILGLLGVLAGSRIRGLRASLTPSRFKTWHVVAMIIAFYGFVVGVGPADHLAHLGGLLAGGVGGYFLPAPGQLRGGKDRWLAWVLGTVALALAVASGTLAFFHR